MQSSLSLLVFSSIIVLLFASRTHRKFPDDMFFTSNITTEETQHAIQQISEILDSSPHYIQKYQYRSLNRLLFIAGLEGTGHHVWEYAIYYCTSRHVCEVEEAITGALMHIDESTWTLHGLFGNENIGTNAQHLAFVYNRMQQIARGEAVETALHIIGIGLVRYSGMMSYPNYDVANKALARPDITTMAALAESAGLDFRVLVLQRDPAAIMASVNRRMFGQGIESNILIANAESLYFQLNYLDKKFYRCVKFEDYGDYGAKGKKNLLKFISPAVGSIWNSMLQHLQYTQSNSTSTSSSWSSTTPTLTAAAAATTHLEASAEPLIRLGDSVKSLNMLYHTKELQLRVRMIDNLCAANPIK